MPLGELLTGTNSKSEKTAQLRLYVDTIKALHQNWKPHPGQVRIGQALFRDQCKDIFVQAGRNFGKTELMIYCLWRWALLNPGSENYYFSPHMKQTREILWASKRLQNFAPRELVASENNTEMRINLGNGSFIKCDGSDNVDSYRGVKPKGLVVFDEFKDFRPEFYTSFEPNRAAHRAPLLIIGTPPDRECQFLSISGEFERNPNKVFFRAPSSENPHLSREYLDTTKAELEARGELDVWQREYEAMYVPGGVSKIFPMLSRAHVWGHDRVLSIVERDLKRLEFIAVADPAAATTFGVLFVCINTYKRIVYAVDELYESDQSRMSVGAIGKRIIDKRNEIAPDAEWLMVYDEAATWFANEMLDKFGEGFQPTSKASKSKEDGLSLIKDLLLNKKLIISDRCVKLFWEMDNYYKDKTGKIPKVNDHLIDCLRYALSASHYTHNTSVEYIEEKDENFRGARISDDFPELDDMGGRKQEWYMEFE